MADASVFALTEEVVVAEAIPLSNYTVEALALDQTFVPFPEVRAVAALRQTLVFQPIVRDARNYHIEVLADDQSFVFPDDLKAVAAAKQTLIQMPFGRPVRNYVVEVLAETTLDPLPQAKVFALNEEVVVSEIPTPTAHDYVVEVLGGASLDQEVSSYMVEVLADDTTPNAVSRYHVEVLADSTDQVALTRQQIIWFFKDH
jgi:hypothetical protein